MAVPAFDPPFLPMPRLGPGTRRLADPGFAPDRDA